MERRWAAGLMLLAAIGCGPSGNLTPIGGGATKVEHPEVEADPILRKMLAAYDSAKAYSDQGTVKLSFDSPAGNVRNEQPLAVTFARPNKLKLNAYQATLVSDGKRFFARIKDEATKDVDGQIVLRDAPAPLKLTDLSADPLLYDTLLGRLQRNPIQLELLLDQAGLRTAATQPGVSKTLARGEPLDGAKCTRVELSTEHGATVLWIDEKDYLLRRVEYPAKQLFPELAADPQVRNLSITAELKKARFAAAEDAFAYEVPADAKIMRTFVVPPKPLPTELFGQRPKPFQFAEGSGAALAQADTEGKVHVWLWFNDDPACEAAMRQFEAVRREFEDNDAFVFHGVCIVPENVSPAAIQRQLTAWDVELPWVRDAKLAGRDVFKVVALPALTVLDAKGAVQIFDQQVGPQLAEQLPLILERVAKGENLAAEVLARAESERAAYLQEVGRGGPEPSQVIAVETPALRPASEPKQWKLTERWRSKQLKQPGNVVAVEGDTPRLFVLDGGRTVAEFNSAGLLLARHELDLPPDVGVSFLRTALAKDGKRIFAAGAPLGAQAFLFDEQWKTKLSYPPAEQRHEGIRDVRLFDLDGKNGPELYVGFWSLLGVHALNLDGERLWMQRDFPSALSLAVSAGKNDLGWRQLLAVGDRGTLLPINRAGHADPEESIPRRPVLQIMNARYEASESPYCVLSYVNNSQLVAVGVNEGLEERWQASLPPGAHSKPIEPITSGPFPGEQKGGWLIAGADGGLQVVGDNGEFRDEWGTGLTLTGVGWTKWRDDVVIIACGDGEVVVWNVAGE